MTITEVNSIQIPDEFVSLCNEWHGGQDCLLYAVASTGNLTMGSIRPRGCDTDEKWYLNLWQGLDSDLSYTIRLAKGKRGVTALRRFQAYVEGIVAQLTTEYGLEDWDGPQ